MNAQKTLKRTIERQNAIIKDLIELVSSERDTEKAAWDMVVDLINGNNYPLEAEFGSESVQAASEKYLLAKRGSKRAQKLAVAFLEQVCRNYINDEDGECIEIKISDTYQR